ncbi:MAG: HEAT repeat domain-containing protein [Spirochaetota bacterium]
MDKVDKYIQDLKESNSTAKRFAAYKLGIMGDTRAFEPLIKALKDRNPFVRCNVAEALGNLGELKALEYLQEYLDDIDFTVKCSVIEAIGNISKYHKEADRSIFNKIIPKLIESLSNDRYIIRHYAADALSKIGGEEVNKALSHILDNGNPVTKEFAIWTISKLKDDSYEEQLLFIFEQSDNINIKRAIIYTLDAMGVDIENTLKLRGINLEKVKDELFDEETFNDRLFFNL